MFETMLQMVLHLMFGFSDIQQEIVHSEIVFDTMIQTPRIFWIALLFFRRKILCPCVGETGKKMIVQGVISYEIQHAMQLLEIPIHVCTSAYFRFFGFFFSNMPRSTSL